MSFFELNAMKNLGRLNYLVLDKYLGLLESESLKSENLEDEFNKFYQIKFKCSENIKIYVCELINIFQNRNNF